MIVVVAGGGSGWIAARWGGPDETPRIEPIRFVDAPAEPVEPVVEVAAADPVLPGAPSDWLAEVPKGPSSFDELWSDENAEPPTAEPPRRVVQPPPVVPVSVTRPTQPPAEADATRHWIVQPE